MMVIVPNSLQDEINKKLDAALESIGAPTHESTLIENIEHDREFMYHQLLSYYDEHGFVPDFILRERNES